MQSFDQMSRERVRAEDQMLQEATQRARHLDEQSREDALSTMKRMPETDGDLTLKPGTSFFGTPGNPTGDVPVDASVVDLRALDPNKPITVDQSVLRLGQHAEPQRGKRHIDCPQTRAARDRLAGGLPVQVAAIQKTEAQLQAARQGVQLARNESKAVLLRAAVDEAKGYAQDVLTSAKGLRAQIGALKGLDPATRDTLIRATNALVFGGEDLQDVFTAAEVGYRAGEEVQRKTDHLSRQVADIADKLLMESGIAEKVGEELAGKLWGPLGELGFRGAKLSIEFGVAMGKGLISQSEQEAAQKHLETMQNQYERAKRRIAELDRDLMDLCTDTAQTKQ
jgi:hypothetical protein